MVTVKKRHLNFLLIFCVLFLTTHSSPIIYLIHKKIFNPVKIFSAAIIATQKYILTTKYPFADYVRSEICALGVSDLEMVQKSYMDQYCIGVKDVDYTPSGLALIKLERPVTFHYHLDAAQIPAVIDKEAENLTRNCKMVYNERNSEGIIIKQNVVPAETEDPFLANSSGILDVNLTMNHTFCVHDNGLPLICEDAVLGVFLFEGKGGSQCCGFDCQEMETVKVIKLYSREVQEFLRKFIFVA